MIPSDQTNRSKTAKQRKRYQFGARSAETSGRPQTGEGGQMRKKLLATLAIVGAVAGATAAQPIGDEPDWRPVTRGLTETPERLLPALISPAHPVRVVSTALDLAGRPIVTVATATDRAMATHLITEGQHASHALGVELDAPVHTADGAEPNVPVHAAGTDALRDQQWDLDAMRVAGAWPRTTGAGVTVAVIDTGVDTGHPDLAGHVLPGADFITGVEGVSIDPHGHGTHVAGTIAALAGNDEGIAGVAPDARILPVRVLNANGAGYMSDVANGIVYAADHGADVINMSISSTMQVDAVTNAVAYARSRGVVVVAAAGNSRGSGSPIAYPAADPGVLAVAATDAADRVASYSNRGGYVDVAAPGNDILSTFPPALGTAYRRMSGTSMAAPHATALAALLKSADRALTPDAVEQAIEASAFDLGVPGRDDDFGYGRIDATAALATLPAPPAPAPTTPTEEPPTNPEATPTTDPTPTPTTDPTEPTPQPSTPETTPPSEIPTPAPSETPKAAQRAYAARSGPQQLTAVVAGVDDQLVEVQREIGTGWATVLTYPATRMVRFDGMPPGGTYRIFVPSSARFDAAVSGTAHL
jgi:type VII secretion-associated serine protease mycosin